MSIVIKRIVFLSFGLFLIPMLITGHAAMQDDGESISGRIITGFRVLDISLTAKTADFTVYRGDYIKFRYSVESGPLPFAVPALTYKGIVQPTPEKSPYFKMKTAGDYLLSLGPITGHIKVVELVRPNYMELSAVEAVKILENLQPFILDVRTPGEYKKIHIADATLIPIQELQARAGELESQKNNDLFIYCATGNRSTVASRILADRGFKRIYNLRYGIYDWARRGNPVIK